MLCYIMTRILGTDGDAEGKHSPGVHCTSLGRLGGIRPARVCGRLRRPQSRRCVAMKSRSPLGGEGAQGTGAESACPIGNAGLTAFICYSTKKLLSLFLINKRNGPHA